MKVYRALQASRFLPRLAGAAPYELSSSSIKFSRIGQILPLFQLLIAASLLCLYRSKIPYEIGEIKTLLITLTTWLQYFVATFSVLKDSFCQQAIIDIVHSIENYDEKIGYDNDALCEKENVRVRFWSFLYSVLLIILTFCRLLAWKLLDLDPASEIFVVQIDNSIYMFAVFATLLGLRFRHLNSMVEKDRYIRVRSRGFETVANPEYVRQLYTSLVTIGERLNDHYSERLFLWSVLTTLALITRCYDMITANVSVVFVVAAIVRLLPAILGLVFFSLACQFTVEQANRMPVILMEKNIRKTALIDRGRKEIFTMSLYMTLCPFEFTALGFFSVDLSLVYAVFTVTVKYLTLCLQSGP